MTAHTAEENHQPGPLGTAEFAEIERAQLGMRKIRSARRFAGFSGWSSIILGALALPFGIASISALVVGVCLILFGWNELRGARRLALFDLGAPRHLALNQLGLAAAIVGYASWRIYASATGESMLAASLASDPTLAGDPQMAAITRDIESLERIIIAAIYITLAIGSILWGGIAAWYYVSRKKHIGRLIAQTPEWVIALERSRAA